MTLPTWKQCCALVLLAAIYGHGQQPITTAVATRSTTFDVTVTRNGKPAEDAFGPEDLKLLDNSVERQPLSVSRVTSAAVPVHAMLVIDAVNISFTRLAYARDQVDRFLKANNGQLQEPTSIVIMTDKGAQITPGFTSDGNALSASLKKADIGLREIRSNSGIWGADERVQISLTALHQLLGYGASIPGRKLILWISPGWPLLSGPRIDLDAKQQNGIFADVVAYSRQMQQAKITMYDINPLGPEEDLVRADFYQGFLKGVGRPRDTAVADLSLQVLAAQSGGRVFNGSSDVAGNLARCEDEAHSWYEVTFGMAAAEHPDEYHHIQVEVDRPGMTARTRDGYYAQP